MGFGLVARMRCSGGLDTASILPSVGRRQRSAKMTVLGECQYDPETASATASVMILELIFFRLSQAKSVKQEAEAPDVASSP